MNKHFSEHYPYTGIERVRSFDEDKTEVSDCYPPSLDGRYISMVDVYFLLSDANRKVMNACRVGHRLGGKKMSLGEVSSLINGCATIAFEKSKKLLSDEHG